MRIFARALRIFAGEVCVHPIDGVELPIATDVIVVRVRVQDDDRQFRQLGDDLLYVADAHAGVEFQSRAFADDEIADGFFRLMRFVDGEDVGRGFVDFEPGIGDGNAFQRFVFGAWKGAAPVGS